MIIAFICGTLYWTIAITSTRLLTRWMAESTRADFLGGDPAVVFIEALYWPIGIPVAAFILDAPPARWLTQLLMRLAYPKHVLHAVFAGIPEGPQERHWYDHDFDDALVPTQVGNVMMLTHAPGQCANQSCCIHNPSDHPLKDAPLHWRNDRGFMERICAHGIGHPDVDDLAFKRSKCLDDLEEYEMFAFDVHGCDGCCVTHGVSV